MAPGAVNGGTDEGDARNPEKTQPFAAIVASLARLIRAPPPFPPVLRESVARVKRSPLREVRMPAHVPVIALTCSEDAPVALRASSSCVRLLISRSSCSCSRFLALRSFFNRFW